MGEKEYVELRDYIELLLKQGKRGNHSDYAILFKIFGKEKIVEIAKDILQREKLADQKTDDKLVK